MKKILVWDVPTRVFHWLLALSLNRLVTVQITGVTSSSRNKFGAGGTHSSSRFWSTTSDATIG